VTDEISFWLLSNIAICDNAGHGQKAKQVAVELSATARIAVTPLLRVVAKTEVCQ